MRVVGESSEAEMVAHFLRGELTSDRFGSAVRDALAAAGLSEQIVTRADVADEAGNRARRDVLARIRGYGQNRDLFDEGFPTTVSWNWAVLDPGDLARVRYVSYDYWDELSGGTRLACDAASRITDGQTAFGVPNDRYCDAAQALLDGAVFPAMILVGTGPASLVCLEGNLRLTALALVGFPTSLKCLVGTDPALARWAH